jgi:CBS domain-containing protein
LKGDSGMKNLKEFLADKRLLYVRSGMNVFDVTKFMDLHNIGAVPILDNTLGLLGLFSERDLLRRCIVKNLDLNKTIIDDVMTKDVIIVEASDTPEYCLHIMKQQKIRHMPVVEDNKLMGLVSMRDLMLHDVKLKDEKIDLLNTYIQYNG